jgi:hypothetical protein
MVLSAKSLLAHANAHNARVGEQQRIKKLAKDQHCLDMLRAHAIKTMSDKEVEIKYSAYRQGSTCHTTYLPEQFEECVSERSDIPPFYKNVTFENNPDLDGFTVDVEHDIWYYEEREFAPTKYPPRQGYGFTMEINWGGRKADGMRTGDETGL